MSGMLDHTDPETSLYRLISLGLVRADLPVDSITFERQVWPQRALLLVVRLKGVDAEYGGALHEHQMRGGSRRVLRAIKVEAAKVVANVVRHGGYELSKVAQLGRSPLGQATRSRPVARRGRR